MGVIQVEGLIKRYGDHTAVDGLSLEVEKGEIFGMLGPNGAGKTTTVECIAGLRTPDEGTITVLGLNPAKDRTEIKQRLGVQLQESELPDAIRVDEALELYSSFYRSPADWRELLAELGLEQKVRTPFRKLSGGQKQRLSIALALLGNPEIAILDELTTGLDPQARRDTWELIETIRDRGVTIILVTHFMDEAERLCDRLALIDNGRIAALDSPAGLVARVDAGQRVRFKPSRPIEAGVLEGLEGVSDVHRTGDHIVVSGEENTLHVVTATLARLQVVAQELRVDQASLDDAFIHLTGRKLED